MNSFSTPGSDLPGPGAPASAPVTRDRLPGILVVDDDASLRTMLELGLQHQGFALWFAAGGQEALEIYRCHAQEIDVVLLDVRMPGMDGPQTLAALKQLNPQIRCCFASGECGDYSEESLLALGACHFLKKPFSLANIIRILRHLAETAPPFTG